MKQMDTLLFQQGQSIDEIKNRLNCIETGSSCGDGGPNTHDNIKPALMSDPEFINDIVDNIMTNSNLSEIIEQIDVVQSENRELRELLYVQQKTINEMNIMLLKLLSQGHNQPQLTQAQDEAVKANEANEANEADEADEADEANEANEANEEGGSNRDSNVELEITEK